MLRFCLFLLAGLAAYPASAQTPQETGPTEATGPSSTEDAERWERESRAMYEALQPVGMAVAVVREGQPVWIAGYGETQAGSGNSVTADTAFPIHSMTKSFTAAALALLVDEGKLAWSDPVRKHIPEFAMSDPYVSEHLTLRDLLVHNSGLALGAGDLLGWPDQVSTPQDVIAALPHLPLDSGFREGFAYDNILYTVAGEVVTRVSGQSWAGFVEERLFAPLGMTSCSTSQATAKAVPTAIQHSRRAGGEPVVRVDIANLEDPAGSISCSARDIARWTHFQLGDGTLPDGTRLMAPERLREMHAPVVVLRPPNFMRRLAGAHFNNAALGWFASDFAGTLMIEHGGAGTGGLTNMILLPEEDAAVVVLVNDMIPAHLVSYRIADLIVRGDGAADWTGWVIEQQARRVQDALESQRADPVRPAGAGDPAFPPGDYAGTYRDAWYGDIVVSHQGGGLRIHFTRSKLLDGPLLPWEGETFLARWPERSLDADALVTFTQDESGRIAGMKIAPLSPETDFSYDYQHLAPVRIEQ
ncbi:MAG: serine hydrolase [Citromicrobium sp.]|nr:serine hydrolase [Citromicrobium sp.]